MTLAVELKLSEREKLSDEHLLELARLIDPVHLRRLAEVEALRWKVFPQLSAGFVTLVDVMGDDTAVVQAARVSFGSGTKHVSESDVLINYLMRHRHTTPFEMAEVKLLICCPMDMWRQQIRHRTASVNEVSTRYSEAIDVADMVSPTAWRRQSKSNKQGSSGLVEEWPNEELRKVAEEFGCTTPGEYLTLQQQKAQHGLRKTYEERLLFDVAREVARMDLPLSTYTLAYWKIDLHNLFHFLGLRMDGHAQAEIRGYATTIGREIVQPLFPKCWAAFEQYRLNATFLSEPAKRVLATMLTMSPAPCVVASFRMAVLHTFPDWLGRREDGTLKAHRERDETLSTLQALGLVQEGDL